MSNPGTPSPFIPSCYDADSDLAGRLREHPATSQWSYRIPTPTRITVPPPHLNVNSSREDAPQFNLTHKLLPRDDVDLAFLNNLDYKYLFEGAVFNNQTWTYSMRREATEILPFLYLGPMSAARDTETLHRLGITMILAIQHRSTLPNLMLNGPKKAATELGIGMDVVSVADNLELIGEFPRAARIVNEHLAEAHKQNESVLPKVLLFCESGNDRSAAVAAAYIMQMFDGIDLVKACQIVNLRRFSANVEEGMKQYLLSYQQILQAQRDAGAVPRTGGPARKRHRFSEDEDEDVTMEEDAERFQGRDPAPFVDLPPS